MDLLHPFDERNSREEKIVCQVDNVLINVNYTVIQHLLSLDKQDEVLKTFPYLNSFIGLNNEDMYMKSLSQTKKDFLIGLSKGMFTSPIETIEDEILFSKLNEFKPLINLSILNLLKFDKIKELTLSSSKWTDDKIEIMKSIYSDYMNSKVYISENTSMLNLFEENKDGTLFWLESVDEFINTVVNKVDLKGKIILFPYVRFNMTQTEDINSASWLYEDEINNICKKYNCDIDFFKPLCLK